MKKMILPILLAVAACVLAACGGNKEKQSEEKTGAATSLAEEKATEETAVYGKKFGLVLAGDENDAYSRSHIEGIRKAAEALGIPESNIIIRYNIPFDNSCYIAISELAEQGCCFVAATSYSYQSYAEQAASDLPSVDIANIGGDTAANAGLENFSNAFTRIHEARYISGVAAGLKIEELVNSGKLSAENFDPAGRVKLGYIGAYPYPEVVSGYTAFFLGVKSVYSHVAMEVYRTNSWLDDEAERSAAKKLIAEGCVVIGQHTDGSGAPQEIEAANREGKQVYCVGYNEDMSTYAPNAAITSACSDWSVYYTYALGAELAGEKPEPDWAGGYDSGAVRISALGTAAAAGSEAKLAETEKGIADGSLKVFDTEKFTVKGKHINTCYIDTDGDMIGDTEAVKDGCFSESSLRSAPSFDLRIDGIVELDAGINN